MTQALTIYLPDHIFQQLQQTVQLAHKSADSIVANSLSHSISPLLEDIPEAYQADVFPLLEMSETELQEEARKTYPAEKADKYEALLEQKKERPLSAEESSVLEKLRRDADILTFRKGYATVLLKRRGHRVPSPNELPRPA